MRGTLLVVLAACSSSPGASIGGSTDAPASPSDVSAVDSALAIGERDQLLTTYLTYLRANPGVKSNGLDGAQLTTVCQLWARLAPSAQATFLTVTARLEHSVLDVDGSTMLSHVTRLYRIVGGSGATATTPGSCGGEGNRLFASADSTLQGTLVTLNSAKGVVGGRHVIVDAAATSFWRDSHDTRGPHAPFEKSDETEGGAPRGQVQFFANVSGTVASSPLGRVDVETLVDPYAMEIDQDYDCAHASNPSCSYTLYGAFCTPKPAKLGVAIYAESYGAVDLSWRPAGC